MKKKIFSLILCAFLLISLSGCGGSSDNKLSGRYEWRPYSNQNATYAYYDFKDNGECDFAGEMANKKLSKQTYSYTINKTDGDNYEIILKHLQKDETITLTYNSKDNTIIDSYFKKIEKALEDTAAPSENDVYGQFKKVK